MRRSVVAVASVAAACGLLSVSADARPAASGAAAAPGLTLAQLYRGTNTRPPASGPKAQPRKKVWVISCSQAVLSCHDNALGMMEAGRIMGWKMTLFDGQFQPAKFSDGIRQAVAAGADGILTVAIDCIAARQAMVEAKQAGVKIVGVWALDCDDPNIGAKKVFDAEPSFGRRYANYAAYDRAWGALKARYLIQKLHGNVKVIETSQDDFLALKYERLGFNDELNRCATCKVVGILKIAVPDLASPTAVREKTSSLLQQHPEANSILVLYDSLVLAGIGPSVLESGRSNSLFVVGDAETAPNLALIRGNKGQDGGVAKDAAWFGWAGVDTLNRVFAGAPLADSGLGFQAVDVGHNLPPAGSRYIARVNFKAIYRKVWGR